MEGGITVPYSVLSLSKLMQLESSAGARIMAGSQSNQHNGLLQVLAANELLRTYIETMDSGGPSETTRAQSPDPSSHATNIYDIENGQDEWLDEEDDDDMDFEPATDESEAMEFFDPAEAEESEFHGMWPTEVSC